MQWAPLPVESGISECARLPSSLACRGVNDGLGLRRIPAVAAYAPDDAGVDPAAFVTPSIRQRVWRHSAFRTGCALAALGRGSGLRCSDFCRASLRIDYRARRRHRDPRASGVGRAHRRDRRRR